MVDFSRLVLRPAMRTFARPTTVTPLASQPGSPAYEARGVWTVRNVDIQMQDGGVLSSDDLTLGVRDSEFVVAPMRGDRVFIPAAGSLPELGLVEIDDTDSDGQGGTVWTLKKLQP